VLVRDTVILFISAFWISGPFMRNSDQFFKVGVNCKKGMKEAEKISFVALNELSIA